MDDHQTCRAAPPHPRIVVIDDSSVIRGGFARVHPGLEVVGTYASVEGFQAAPVACDVVVLDLLLRGPQGGTSSTVQGRCAIRSARDLGHPVCLYTDERRPLVLAQCLRSGADGIVHKSDPPETVVRAVRDVHRGGVVVTQSLVGLIELLDRRGAAIGLNPLQRQVISARARGRHWNHIAADLSTTEAVARARYWVACAKLRDYLRTASPGEVERALGLLPGELLDEE